MFCNKIVKTERSNLHSSLSSHWFSWLSGVYTLKLVMAMLAPSVTWAMEAAQRGLGQCLWCQLWHEHRMWGHQTHHHCQIGPFSLIPWRRWGGLLPRGINGCCCGRCCWNSFNICYESEKWWMINRLTHVYDKHVYEYGYGRIVC